MLIRRKSINSEKGETQMGLLVGALVIGVLVAITSWLQDYIAATKDYKLQQNIEAYHEKYQNTVPVKRFPRGHTVQY